RPDLAEDRVDEDAVLLWVPMHGDELARDVAPRHPADRRVERVQVIAADAADQLRPLDAPLSVRQHLRLLMGLDLVEAGPAFVDRLLGREVQLRPGELREDERLHLATVWARHVVPTLV